MNAADDADDFNRPQQVGAKTGPREVAKALGAPSVVVTKKDGNPQPNSNPNET